VIKLNSEIEDKLGHLIKGCTVASHHDADGVTSLYLFSLVYPINFYHFPSLFGETESIRYENEYHNIDVMLDMVPRNDLKNLIVIDHHNHPDIHKYYLIHDNVPTSLILYNLFKDLIPDEDKWKVCVGLVGDGRAELIPVELWDKFPVLLESLATVRTYRGNLSIYKNIIWYLLSSNINYACRVGKPGVAYNSLKAAKYPTDIIRDSALNAARETINIELRDIEQRFTGLDLGRILLYPIESEYVVESLLAAKLSSREKKLIIVINTRTGNGSIRGVLSNWLVSKLTPKGYELGGHPGYAGINIGKKSLEEFMNDLRSI